MSDNKPCIAPNGYQFPIGEELRLHLNEGGFVQVDYRDKWYRARANKQEVLYGTRAAMVRASKRSIVEATGVYAKSKRAECHARPVAVWRRA